MAAMAMRDIVGVFAGVVIVTTLVILLDFSLSKFKKRSLAWQQVDSQSTL